MFIGVLSFITLASYCLVMSERKLAAVSCLMAVVISVLIRKK